MDYQQLLGLELVKQSPLSPCTISNEEIVSRAIFAPNHYKNNKIQSAAFEQIISDPDGMSVLRKSYSFTESLRITIEIMENKGKSYVTNVSAKVLNIRNILCEKNRLVCVIDTAKKNRIAHADLISTRKVIDCSLDKKATTLFLRREIAKVFNAV